VLTGLEATAAVSILTDAAEGISLANGSMSNTGRGARALPPRSNGSASSFFG